jgi:hypothetical protein
MKAGANPIRRSRNIGTAKQGHGQNNRLVIPDVSRSEREWKEQLNPHQCVERRVRGRNLTFIVEDNHGGCVHACTVDDLSHVLENIPSDDWRGVATFVLRQSTHKQRLLNPVWGRLYYNANLGLAGGRPRRTGPAIVLEAMNCNDVIEWPSSLRPSEQEELERLRADGHQVRQDGRRYIVSTTLTSVRATQLYRTLLHEIGHWVNFLEKVIRPTDAGNDKSTALRGAYFSRTNDERESFAHHYADTMRTRLMKFGIIPFNRIEDQAPRNGPDL